jgi:poly(3-hydroxybutyrate) depolymerase/protein-S-isoprenylcysteine O-methyltransferase Ste14
MSRAARALAAAYSIAAYAISLAVFAWFVAFLAGVAVPKGVDDGPVEPAARALGGNALLLALFGVQHSVMARASFKRWWTRVVPPAIERSTYLLATAAVLALIALGWRPVPAEVWSVEQPVAAWALRAAFWGGIALVLVASFAISHAELFGLAPARAARRGERAEAPPRLATPWLYRVVRHPMQLGFLLAAWATPLMTVGRLELALGMTAYILIGLHFEERDLTRAFGDDYAAYRRRVPRLVPRLGPAALGALLLLATAAGASWGGAADADGGRGGTVRRARISVDGLERSYRVYLPRQAGGARSGRAPGLVIALHGAAQSGALLRALIGERLERLADSAGFLVAYPDGHGRAWNECRRLAPYAAKRDGVDDVAFARALAAQLHDEHGADARRVHALGFSNGGHLALRLALEAPDLVRSAVAIGASLPLPADLDCVPSGAPAPVMFVLGTEDPINPHAGGTVRLPDGRTAGRVWPAMEGARRLAALGGSARLREIPGGRHAIPVDAASFAPLLRAPDWQVDAIGEGVGFMLGWEDRE